MPELGDDPYEEDLDWLKHGRVMIQESPKVLDEAARSFLTLGSSLLTVYTGALALFKLNDRAYGPLSWVMICTPILLWLLCISCFAYVYFPDRLRFGKNSPSDIEEATLDVSQKKSKRLKIGSVLFVAALATMSISIVWLGAQLPSSSSQVPEVKFVIPADETASSQNISISFKDETSRNAPLRMVLNRNKTYTMTISMGAK